MKWLKLSHGGLVNLDRITYIYADSEGVTMFAPDEITELSEGLKREIWSALQEPNTVVPLHDRLKMAGLECHSSECGLMDCHD